MSGLLYFKHSLGRRPLFPYNNHSSNFWLDTIYHNKWFEELIYWSSSSLHAELLKLKAGDLSTIKTEKVIKSLYSYLVRSYSRCTPFGITAGFYTAAIENKETPYSDNNPGFRVGNSDKLKRIVSPDSIFLTALIESILLETPLSSSVRYFFNPTIYKLGSNLRFHERLEAESYRISTIEGDDIIDEIASHITNGGTIEFMLNLLGTEFDDEEKIQFIYSLIEENILVNEFDYFFFEKTPLTKLTQYLSSFKDENSIFFKGVLKKYQVVMDHLEQSELGDYQFEDIEHIKSDLRKFIDKKCLQNLFHIDLVVPPNTKRINSRDLDLISECIECLTKIVSSQKSKTATIDQFKNAFFERYNNELVPILEVLDGDIGLGFPVSSNFGVKQGSELLSDIRTPSENINNRTSTLSLKPKLTNRLEKLLNERNQLDLSEIDLSGMKSQVHNLPKTFSVVCSKLSDGNVLISNIGGSSSLNLLGRFSIGNDEVHALCKEIIEKEKEIFIGVVIAEIVFIPEGKSGNITKKKVSTDYYIPVNSGLDIPTKRSIALDDLHVAIEKGQVILISKKLNRRVLPRLSSAHNFHNSSSVIYKFLCSIQHDHKLDFALDSLFTEGQSILKPRIKYKGLIIRPSLWKLNVSHYKHLIGSEFDESLVKNFLDELGLPNEVAIKEGDNELPLKLDNQISLKIIWDSFRKGKNIDIIEWLHFQENNEESLQYVSQTIISMFQGGSFSYENADWFSHSKSTSFFLPGSEVLSFKLYCGAFISDDVLRVILSDIACPMVNNNVIKRFYFVRYNDPHHHIRVRFFLYGQSSEVYNQILEKVTDKIERFKQQRLVWKMEVDTYERELKRYSSINIELAEYIFYQDSRCFLFCLDNLPSLDDELTRLSIGVLNVQFWFQLVGFDFEKQVEFLRKRISASKTEFEEEIGLQQINDLYRKYKLEFNNFDSSKLQMFFRNRNIEIVKESRNFSKECENIIPVLQDIIHMSQNRLFNSNQRLNEFIVYALTEKVIINHQFQTY